MNKTEEKALNWILAKENIPREGVIYQASRSPDFLLPDGRSYEVKRLYGNQIMLYRKQYEALRQYKDCKIIVFGEGDSPVTIIPLVEIGSEGLLWGNIRVNLIAMSSKSHRKNIYFTNDLYDRLQSYLIQRYGQGKATLSIVVEMAVKEYLDREEAKP